MGYTFLYSKNLNHHSHVMPPTKRDSIAIPVAIVVAAGLIAGAIYLSSGTQGPAAQGPNGTLPTTEAPEIRQTDENDHIRGNPNAPIMFVEYSDFDCPYCKNFHETMVRIMDEYGSSGKVAWAYRHYPIAQLHPNSPKIAEASECVAELGGHPAFWTFADIVFREKPTNDSTEMARLSEFAEAAGVVKSDFESCLASGRHAAKITASISEAVAAGAKGTPHTLVLLGEENGIINGAQPYEVVKQIVDNLVAQLDNPAAAQ